MTSGTEDPYAVPEGELEQIGGPRRRASKKVAQKDQQPPLDLGWKGEILTSGKSGEPLGNIHNCLLFARNSPEIASIVAFDEFRQRIVARGDLPWAKAMPGVDIIWSDAHDANFTAWVQAQHVNAPVNVAAQAIDVVAREHAFHPVKDYLSGLQWDGTVRLENTPHTFFGAEVDAENEDARSSAHAFVGAAFAKFAISAVARVFRPGCKVDSCLVLEGRQGILKSTALRLLFTPWFTDDIAELGSKDSAMQLSGAWCVEIPEFASGRRADKERLKAYLSRAVDRFRPTYARRVIEVPRQSVFASSVNDSDYLRDETGNRRFWPITCTRIDIDGLATVKDQLWAEAASRFHADEPWWMDDESLLQAAQAEQDARYSADVWRHKIVDYLEGKDEVSVAQVLEQGIGKPTKEISRADQMRASAELVALGWVQRRRRLGNAVVRYYEKPGTG